MSENVKTRAINIFTRLAKAEGKVHGIDAQKVHFHEVGAMDAIIDVVGACVGFELLGIEKFACSEIHVGSGLVKMAHGKFPVPPPAVAELLKNIPIYSTEIEGELITPTGAAIISALCEEFGNLPEMRVEKTAYGAGTRDYKDFPNVLRLMIGEIEASRRRDDVKMENGKWKMENQPQINTDEHGFETKDQKPKTKNRKIETKSLLLIETNIDDLSPQILGFVMERAFDLGALDCWFTPIQMKKNRPATMISILCGEEKREAIAELLYTETTTLGIRVREIERDCLERDVVKVETDYGAVDVKIARYGEKIVNTKPEYEHLRQIALKSKTALREVEKEVLKKLNGKVNKIDEK